MKFLFLVISILLQQKVHSQGNKCSPVSPVTGKIISMEKSFIDLIIKKILHYK